MIGLNIPKHSHAAQPVLIPSNYVTFDSRDKLDCSPNLQLDSYTMYLQEAEHQYHSVTHVAADDSNADTLFGTSHRNQLVTSRVVI